MKHPAKFSPSILDEMKDLLSDVEGRVLDPFAGTGRIHWLRRANLFTVGIEIEPEWATMDRSTICGNALHLPFPDASFDAICTSPTYGNRMADHHNAKDGSKRNTYKHTIGRDLHPDNSGAMHWGPRYKAFHESAWREAIRVLKPGGVFILNVKNFFRDGEEIDVTDWHVRTLQDYLYLGTVRTPTVSSYREGSNSHLRASYESVIRFTKPDSGNPVPVS